MTGTPCVAPYFDGTQPCAQTDPELFFPEKGGSVREARRVCGGCEFAAACLEYALTNDVVGVWGGTSEQQRRHIQRHRTRGPQPIKHGTEGGAAAHRRRGEKACDSCAQANRLARRLRAERAA